MPKRYYWLKMPDDYFANKEIKKLRQIAGGDTYVIIYLKLQLLSVKTKGVLVFDGIGEDFVDEMALAIDEKRDNVGVTLNFLEKCGLLKETGENEFTLQGTIKMIGSETESAERQRKFREKGKTNSLSNNNLNQKALQCNSNVTNGDDIENREEKEIEKEIDSYLDCTYSEDNDYQIDYESYEKHLSEKTEKKESESPFKFKGFQRLIDRLNQKTGQHYTLILTPPATLYAIDSLFRKGQTEDDFFYVIDVMCEIWKNEVNSKGQPMANFLTLKTLFGPGYQDYRNKKFPEAKKGVDLDKVFREYEKRKQQEAQNDEI